MDGQEGFNRPLPRWTDKAFLLFRETGLNLLATRHRGKVL